MFAAAVAAYFMGVLIFIGINVLAYWRGNPVTFMICSGISLMLGLYSPDALAGLGYSTFGISIGILLVFYAFVNIGLAYGNLFKKTEEEEE